MILVLLTLILTLDASDDADPKKLAPGPQSRIAAEHVQAVAQQLRLTGKPASLESVGQIQAWIASHFTTKPAGGAKVGKTDVNQLLSDRTLSGCHDWGLLLASLLRLHGCPAMMLDTAGIGWAKRYTPGDPFVGHVFVEAFVEGKWIVIDPTSGRYLPQWRPGARVIPIPVHNEKEGFHVLYRGKDPAVYGVTSIDVLTAEMVRFARRVHAMELHNPPAEIRRLPKPTM